MKNLLFPVEIPKEDKTIIGKIVKKEWDMYVIQDKKNRQYTVRSILSFEVGKTVITKKGIILNTIQGFEKFKSFVV